MTPLLGATPSPQALKDAILATQRGISTPSGVNTTIASFFGARSLSQECFGRVVSGASREEDAFIVERLVHGLVMHRGGDPFRILELGCGRSFAVHAGDDSFGAPFLARAIATSLGKRVEVTISDPSLPFDGSVVWVNKNGELFVAPAEHQKDLMALDTTLEKSQIPSELLLDTIYYVFRDHFQCSKKLVERVYLRPELDAVLEQQAFGIAHIRVPLWYGHHAELPTNRTYDFVFARHQYVARHSEIDTKLLESLSAYARPEAEIVF